MARIIKQQTQFRNQNIGLVRFENLQTPKTQAILNAVDKGNQILLREVEKDMQKQTDKMVGEYTISQLTAIDDETGAPELLSLKNLAGMGANQRERYTALVKQNHANAIEQDIKYRVGILKRKYKTIPNGADEFVKATQNFAETYINDLGNAQGEYRSFIENAATRSIQDNELILREQRAITEFNNQSQRNQNEVRKIHNDAIIQASFTKNGEIAPLEQILNLFTLADNQAKLNPDDLTSQALIQEGKVALATALNSRLSLEGTLNPQQKIAYEGFLTGRKSAQEFIKVAPEFEQEIELILDGFVASNNSASLKNNFEVSFGKANSTTAKGIEYQRAKDAAATNKNSVEAQEVIQDNPEVLNDSGSLQDTRNVANHLNDLTKFNTFNAQARSEINNLLSNTLPDNVSSTNIVNSLLELSSSPKIIDGKAAQIDNLFGVNSKVVLIDGKEANQELKDKLQATLFIIQEKGAAGNEEQIRSIIQNLNRTDFDIENAFNNRFKLNDKDPTVNNFLRNDVFKGIPISQAEINRYVPMVNYLTKFEEDDKGVNISKPQLKKAVLGMYNRHYHNPHEFEIGVGGKFRKGEKINGSLSTLPNNLLLEAEEIMERELNQALDSVDGKKYTFKTPENETEEQAFLFVYAPIGLTPQYIAVDAALNPIYWNPNQGAIDAGRDIQDITPTSQVFEPLAWSRDEFTVSVFEKVDDKPIIPRKTLSQAQADAPETSKAFVSDTLSTSTRIENINKLSPSPISQEVIPLSKQQKIQQQQIFERTKKMKGSEQNIRIKEYHSNPFQAVRDKLSGK